MIQKKKPKVPKLSTLQTKADDIMSKYIRQKFSVNGYVKCVSCGGNFHWKDVDCGHFIPKSRGAAVRWVEENVAPECKGCNRFNDGHLIGYTLWVVDWYGRDKVDELKALARKVLSPSQKRQLAEDAIEYYGAALKELGDQNDQT